MRDVHVLALNLSVIIGILNTDGLPLPNQQTGTLEGTYDVPIHS